MKRGPRLALFAGKGGVGKTSCAAAFALGQALAGQRVLVVSTDPAHSLGDALAVTLGARPVTIGTKRGSLHAAEIDADRALARWLASRRRALAEAAERGTYLDAGDIDKLLRLSLPGVDELAGLLELRRLARAGTYDLVVVDTAPAGHTLRLLRTPDTLQRIAAVFATMEAKHHALLDALAGRVRADAVDAVIAGIDADGRDLERWLTDPTRCDLTWILLPEELSVRETIDGLRELGALGVRVAELWINRVEVDPTPGCPHCAARVRAAQKALGTLHREAGAIAARTLPELRAEPRGLRALERFARVIAAAPPAPQRSTARRPARTPVDRRVEVPSARRGSWLKSLVPDEVSLCIVGGKGGVGKTTIAATVALALAHAHPHRRVLLLSVDPAHSLGDVLDATLDDTEQTVAGAPGNLRVREMDAARAFATRRERYRDEVDAVFDALRGGSSLDATYDRAVVRELIDLSPPGLDELFAVLSIVEALIPATGKNPRYHTVVLDTAPTGHALRLLDLPSTALEWIHALLAILLKYRGIARLGDAARDLLSAARDLRALISLLHDGAGTRFVPVTRAAALPRVETVRLFDALAERGVPTGALVVNAATPVACSRCARAAAIEQRERARLLAALRSRARAPCGMLVCPASAPPPRGVRELLRWSRWIEVTTLEPHGEKARSEEARGRKGIRRPICAVRVLRAAR